MKINPEIVAQVARLRAAFPNQKLPQETVNLYAEKLSSIHPALLAAAVDRVIDTAKFLPTIAEIRIEAARISGELLPTTGEMQALMRRADVRESKFRRDGSLAYVERYWRWPDDAPRRVIEMAQAVLEKVGDPVDDKSGEDVFAWDTGFGKAYEREVEGYVADLDLTKALPAPERNQLAAPKCSRCGYELSQPTSIARGTCNGCESEGPAPEQRRIGA